MLQSRQFRELPERTAAPFKVAPTFRGANIVDAGLHNRSLVLQTIRAKGQVTRVDIAQLTGLCTPTVFKIARQLHDDGLIVVGGRKNGQRGQPATELTVNPDGAFAFGLNIDRDHLTLLGLDFAGVVRVCFSQEIAFASPDDVRAFVGRHMGDALLAAPCDRSRIVGIGVAMPDELGAITLPRQPEAYRQWQGMTAQKLLNGVVDLKVVQENDAAAAAIGEMMFGGGLEADSFFYLYLGAGLGGGLVVNRRYYRGARGRSGEIGFLPQFNPFRPRMTRLDRTLGDALLMSRLYERLEESGIRASSPQDLRAQAVETEPCVRAWTAEVSDYLYPALLTLMYTVDPDAIYFGGRLPRELLNLLCEELNRRLSLNLGTAWPKRIVRPSHVGGCASAVGGAAVLLEEAHNISRPKGHGGLRTHAGAS